MTTLKHLVGVLRKSADKADVTEEHLWYAIRGAINPQLLVSNLAEALRIPSEETELLLTNNGFGDIVAQKRLSEAETSESLDTQAYRISSTDEPTSPFSDIFSIEFSPPLHQPIDLSPAQHEAVSLIVETVAHSALNDPFLALYRTRVREYHDNFLMTDAKLINQYITEKFRNQYPRYLVTTGIGADEEFNHFARHFHNFDQNRRCTWLVIDSPRHLAKLPKDATAGNTLFMEFSRSGKTEETVKVHEYTPREAKRIVFANSGPLREIGLRDENLVLELPDQVAGRFGKNKTPILLAPMYVAGMDTNGFWQAIENAIAKFDLSSPTSLPLQTAQFIYLHQQRNRTNHIYFGCNDDVLAFSRDELIQFWNEGVNKDGNDISMSGYFGLLRDSHANIEGILANHKTKIGMFLLRENMCPVELPPMTSREIDPINETHAGLCFGEEEGILAEANYQRFSEVMPTIKILVQGDLTMKHAAILGQFWADLTFCYSRMVNVDPGSNPEVKYVRDRSAKLLAEFAAKRRPPVAPHLTVVKCTT
jgi:hypothetical protein